MSNKKTKKKHPKVRKTALRKGKPVKKTVRKKLARRKAAPTKKPASKKAAAKTNVVGKKTVGALKKRVSGRGPSLDTETFALHRPRSRSAGQSGDLQGLSGVEGADSESVDELLEEGNAFEADVVAGVENAGDSDEKEVRTHEVPEDDVPGEYLDRDNE